MPFPNYTLAEFTNLGAEPIDAFDLSAAITAAGPFTTTFEGCSVRMNGPSVGVTAHFDASPSSANQLVVDGVIAAYTTKSSLDVAKAKKVASIDVRTRELIDQGFQYPPSTGDIFSLSTSAQRTLIAADAQRTDSLFTYPVKWNSKDDLTTISLATAADLHGFAMTAVGTVRAHLDSGTVLKDAVRAATTVAAVDAVVDNR